MPPSWTSGAQCGRVWVSVAKAETGRGKRGPVPWHMGSNGQTWEFPKIRGTLFGVLIIRILLFRVLY